MNTNNNRQKNLFVLLSLITLALIIIGTPIIVHYRSPQKRSEITADGMLGYIIGSLGFLSTLILSALALWQTHHNQQENDKAQEELKKLNDRMLELEENNYKIKLRPFINIDTYYINYYNKNDYNNGDLWIEINDDNIGKCGTYPGLTLSLVNTTDSLLTLSFEAIKSNNVNLKKCLTNQMLSKLTLRPAESKNIIIMAEQNTFLGMSGKKFRLSFILENRFAQKYKESFDMIFIYINNIEGKLQCSISFQDYSLIKFNKNENGKLVEIEEVL